MIVGEAMVIAIAGFGAAVPPAMLAGGALLDLLKDADQVAAGVSYSFGPVGSRQV